MFLFASAIIVAASPPANVAASVQATATIRVVRAIRVKLDGSYNPGVSAPRVSRIKLADGSSQVVKVIEFQ